MLTAAEFLDLWRDGHIYDMQVKKRLIYRDHPLLDSNILQDVTLTRKKLEKTIYFRTHL